MAPQLSRGPGQSSAPVHRWRLLATGEAQDRRVSSEVLAEATWAWPENRAWLQGPGLVRPSPGRRGTAHTVDNCGSNLDQKGRGDLFEQVVFKLR